MAISYKSKLFVVADSMEGNLKEIPWFIFRKKKKSQREKLDAKPSIPSRSFFGNESNSIRS